MGAVVYGQTNGNNVVDNRYTIECNIPEIEKTEEEQVNQSNAQKNEHGNCEVGGNDHKHDENGSQSETNIHNSLLSEHNVSLKVKVSLSK